MKLRFIVGILIGIFLISLISASSDVQVWTGSYTSATAYKYGTYSFNFTIYDDSIAGEVCYNNITSLSTGYLGQWNTEQYNVLASCSNQSKNYFLNIRIDGVDQPPRRRLTLIGNWTTHELKNFYEPFWINDTILSQAINLSLITRINTASNNLQSNISAVNSSSIAYTNLINNSLASWISTIYQTITNVNTASSNLQNNITNINYSLDNKINTKLDSSDQRYNFTNKNVTLENINPQTTNEFSIGSSILRWLIGYFINLDVSNNMSISNNLTVGKNIDANSINTTNSAQFGGNLIVAGNMSIKRPYGMYSSTKTQTCAVSNTAYPMTFNITEDSWLINKASDSSNFTFLQSGDYLIELSVMAQSTSPGDRAYIWLQKNGVNINRSNTLYDFKAANSQAVIAVPFIVDILPSDTIRVMYAGSATAVQFPFTTNTSFAPSTPSAIMTITKISEIAGTPYSGGPY